MNRTITMNLSGIIFHIEDDAYEKLNKYLSTIKGYFNATEGRDEIMGDIESRIAEMLQAKVSQTKQAVLLADVESIIAVMGKPEDFASENEEKDTRSAKEATASEEYSYRKRLFRDPDDKVIGGVSAGISHYFGLEPIWIRIAFAVGVFVFGLSPILYFILWVIMPLARTTAEKLQMRGEKVDINNIGKAVNEELNDLKKRATRFGNEMNSPGNRERFRDAAHTAGDLLRSGFIVVGKVFAGIVLGICILILIGLLAGIFGKGNFSMLDDNGSVKFNLYEIGHAVLPADISPELIVTTLILFLGVPLIFIIYHCIKVLFNIKQRNRGINIAAGVLWIIGIALMVYAGINIGTDFSTESSVKKNMSITTPANKKLFLDVTTLENDFHGSFIHYGKHGRKVYNDDWTIFSKEDNHYRLGYARLDIVPSEADSFQVVVIKSAHGPNREEANLLARNIAYEFKQRDSLITFNNYFDISDNDKFRAQDVKIILKVPVNGIIYLSSRMGKIIYDIQNVNNTLDADMVNRTWKMTNQGLECIDCTGDEATIDIKGNDDEEEDDNKHIFIRRDEHGETIETTHNGKKTIIRRDEHGETIETRPDEEKKVIIHKTINKKDETDTEDKGEGEEKKVIIKKEIRTDKDDKKLNSQISIPFHLVPFSSGSKTFS